MKQYQTLIVPIIAWFTVQLFKFIMDAIKYKRINLKRLFETGGMPSSHSAVVSSLMTVVGFNEGVDSSVFAVAFAFSFIVMYDAAGVRRAAGKQARILNQIIYSNQFKINTNEKLKELLGHTPVEVICGAIYGIILGMAAYLI
jgi:acid phosphatase family membrane protein YuiD